MHHMQKAATPYADRTQKTHRSITIDTRGGQKMGNDLIKRENNGKKKENRKTN